MPNLLDLPLAHGALIIAQDEYPSLPVAKYLKKIDFMGYEIQSRLSPLPSPPVGKRKLSAVTSRTSARAVAERLDRIDAVVNYLFSEQGFQGNSVNYYDPRNNFLNEVLDRRLGLPITLSILTIELFIRMGLKAWGIGFPSHFMVGVELEAGKNLVIDPFHKGARLTDRELAARLEMQDGAGAVKPEVFALDRRAIYTRLLNNLKLIYWNERRYDKALPVLERLVEINPEHIAEFRDRGLAHYQLSRYPHALMDLERYLFEMERAQTRVRPSSPGVTVNPHFAELAEADPDMPKPHEEIQFVSDMVKWLRRKVPQSQTLH